MDASKSATLLRRELAMPTLFFVLVGFSITNAIVFLHVFEWLRELACGVDDFNFRKAMIRRQMIPCGFRVAFVGRLFHCHACMGFWVGVLLSFAHGSFILDHVGSISFYESVVLDGFLLSGTNFIAWVILRKLGAEEL